MRTECRSCGALDRCRDGLCCGCQLDQLDQLDATKQRLDADNTQERIEVRPCGFCGSILFDVSHDIERPLFWVVCCGCHAKGPPGEIEGPQQPDSTAWINTGIRAAIAKYNTRVL
jgi:hypothetical protein